MQFASCLLAESYSLATHGVGLLQRMIAFSGLHKFIQSTSHEEAKVPSGMSTMQVVDKPGTTQVWWDSFVSNMLPPMEWRENFRCPLLQSYRGVKFEALC